MSAEPRFPVRALWRLAVGQPQLLAVHVVNYAGLIRDEGRLSMSVIQRRLALWTLAVVGVTTGAILAGVALMLWATTLPAALQSAWVLLVTPLVPWIVAVWAWSAARRLQPISLWSVWQAQVDADAELLRQFADR